MKFIIQWIGPPREGEPTVVERATHDAPDLEGAKRHAKQLFLTVQKPGAHGMRILDKDGVQLHVWAPDDE